MQTLFEINVFTILLLLATILLVWLVIGREIASTRRMKCMMDVLGLDYDLEAASASATKAIIAEARARCLRCRNEGLCERWLEAKGKNACAATPGENAGAPNPVNPPDAMTAISADDFCPNATTFRALARQNRAEGPSPVDPGDDGGVLPAASGR